MALGIGRFGIGNLNNEIKDEFYRNDCHDNVIMVIAMQEKNKQKCNEPIDQKRMEECAAGAEGKPQKAQ